MTETQEIAPNDWRTQYRDIEQAILAELSAAGIEYVAVLVQENAVDTVGETPWQHDAWRITFKRRNPQRAFSLDFKTGTGHRKARNKYIGPKPVAPLPASVLHSICSDDTHGEDFDSWAANYGYSDDSIKALDTYRACQKQTKAAHEFFGRELLAKIAELVQEY